jgi:hypothetical protein
LAFSVLPETAGWTPFPLARPGAPDHWPQSQSGISFLRCAGLPNLSFGVSLRYTGASLGYKLAHDLGKFLPDYNVVTFGAVLEFTALVLESFGGSQAESSNQTTACGVFDFRVFSYHTDENDFVYAFQNLTP